MISMKVHHIGYLVDSVDQSIDAFRMLGYSLLGETIFDEDRQAFLALLRSDSTVVELVQPVPHSPLLNLRAKFKNAPYHICYTCADLEEECQSLRNKGFFPVREPEPAILFRNRRVCFMMHRQIGMIELLEDEMT